MEQLGQQILIGGQGALATDHEALARHFSRAQSLASTGSWEWDLATNDIIWSLQIFRIFGVSPNTFRPTFSSFLECVHPEDREMVAARARLALSGAGDYTFDHRIVQPDGSVRVVHEEAEVEYDDRGKARRMIGAVQDVTAMRAAQSAVHRGEEMLSGLLRISPEAIIVLDASHRIIAFSSGAEDIFGCVAADVLGQGVDQFMPERFRGRHRQHMMAFAGGADSTVRMHKRSEIVGLRRDGREFPASASLAKLETPDGAVFAVVVRDLTQQKGTEFRLIMARDQAEKANAAKSTFLANMSHEIRTPLNGVLGVTGALARTDLNAKQREMLKIIESSGRALEALLSDILDLAKLEAGHMAVRAEAFDLGELLREAVALFQASAAEKGVDLRLIVEPGAEGGYVGDNLRIRQVLSNLLSNAVKFTASGEVRLTVSTAPGGRGPRPVRFSVSDTGVGFSRDEAARLFERFEQADGSTTRQYGGSGLGLAISKSLVELMDGTISATAVPGQGATFTFELPLPRLADVVPEAAEPPGDGAVGRPLQVLLAEDHAVNRLTVEFILESLPVSLTSVENGLQAVEAADAHAFDLILTDMQMPVMDGLEAIRRIRAQEADLGRPRTPICVITANTMTEHREGAVAAGADAFLPKPISAQALIDLVLDIAGRAGGA